MMFEFITTVGFAVLLGLVVALTVDALITLHRCHYCDKLAVYPRRVLTRRGQLRYACRPCARDAHKFRPLEDDGARL